MDPSRLDRYAELLVRFGLNLDPGQPVLLTAGLDQPDFVRLVIEKCYRAGASKVEVVWEDMPTARLHQLHQSEQSLSTIEEWKLARWKWVADNLPARLWLDSDDPDGMAGIDQGKRARSQMAWMPKVKPYRDAIENRHQWCIAAVPGRKWAEKVFPGVPGEVAEEKLWSAILSAARADGDPLENWRKHNEEIHARCGKLNSLGLAALRYRSDNGTDFEVGLISRSRFSGAAETDLSGRRFNPNIPSEEIFTTPKRGVAEGLLVATKPLSWQGSLIEDFSIRFHEGRAVEVRAARGQEALERMIRMDEGAAFLGECALIDFDSPINRSGILFYNTLFDENACCHVALGRGFNDCVAGYEQFSQEELRELGVNDSLIHVDFMIGSRDLDITGVTADGREIPLFRHGSWA